MLCNEDIEVIRMVIMLISMVIRRYCIFKYSLYFLHVNNHYNNKQFKYNFVLFGQLLSGIILPMFNVYCITINVYLTE